MTTMMSVLDILRSTTESVDFGTAPADPDENGEWWESIIKVKARDTGFGALVDSILLNGFDPHQPIGWYEWENGDREITEGHHRLVAAILLGLDKVPVSQWGGGSRHLCAHCDCTDGVESYSVEV